MAKLNPDGNIVNAIVRRIRLNDGYCPCKPEEYGNPDYLCQCKEFRENKKCCCELYVG